MDLSNSYLGFLQTAASTSFPDPKLDEALDCDEMIDRVNNLLLDPAGVHAERKNFSKLLLDSDADWTPFVHFQLRRVRAVNALGGPRMRVVWHKTFRVLGRIPRYPEDAAHILDAEKAIEAIIAHMDGQGKVVIAAAGYGDRDGEEDGDGDGDRAEGRVFCAKMFSHRWERSSPDPACAHPDDPAHKKARALAEYGRGGVCTVVAQQRFEYFFWVDYAGIDQRPGTPWKALGIAKLPAYIASCIETIFYLSRTPGLQYEPRAWTRLERMLSYVYNSCARRFVLLDEEYGACL